MSARLSRKAFMRGLLSWGLCQLTPGAQPEEGQVDDPELAALAADFPQEALRAEVVRLGLDPGTMVRAEMLAAVRAAMRGNNVPSGTKE
ncbi:hypothetical protein [Desulfocurvibacter africanus]|uniref:hypothetical protein n=1 Tax=Desulfocurvibacter africanus TaxID=873 RepID=UPI0003F9C206|nr:hypothetical protein [Desulfocurvibacter africanus]